MNNKKKSKDSVNIFVAAVLIFTVGIIPAVCRLKERTVSGVENILRDKGTFWDIFSYQKSVLICISGTVLLCSFLLNALTENEHNFKRFKKPQFAMIGVYALFAVISAVFSSYKPVSFNGITERYEGLFVLMSYVIFFIFTQIFIENEKSIKFIIAGFFLSALIVGGIGFFQFFGKDIFASKLAKDIFVGSEYRDKVTSLNIKLDSVYSTLYNPNCVGAYSAMLAPFFIALGVFLPVKNYLKYPSIFFGAIMVINLVGSDSAGGLVGFGAAMVVLAVVFLEDMFVNKRVNEKPVLYKTVFGLGVLFVILAAASVLFVPQIKSKVSSAIEGALNRDGDLGYRYKSMRVDGSNAYIETEGGELMISYDKNSRRALLYGLDKQLIEGTKTEQPDNSDNPGAETANNTYSYDYINVPVSEKENCNYSIQYIDNSEKGDKSIIAYVVLRDWIIAEEKRVTQRTFMFCADSEGNLTPLTKKLQPLKDEDIAPHMIFNNMYFATGRGYIWSRSIPVVLRRLFIGSGPDTFAFEFPQNDLYAKLQSQGDPYVIVDKPHNLYIQTAVNTGGISLIALLTLFIYYIFRTFKTIAAGKPTGFRFAVQAAALAGVCGYLVSGLATDSVVGVAPVFWVLLGMGCAVDEM